jgi:hypothetical protein
MNPATTKRGGCRSQKQKWELAAVAEEHMQLAIRRVHAELAATPATPQEFSRQPGLAMVLDMLGARRRQTYMAGGKIGI